MCGLTGIFDPSLSTPADTLRRAVDGMAETLRHRGPDDSGNWVDQASGIALGFRRLSIVDLSVHGHQPMQSHGGRYVIAFNGEIYNYRSLRQELEAGGETSFRGDSDTEVLLCAIERWGLEATLRHTIGMFALALWDRQRQSLYLARDRMGEKPLYYGWADRSFLFGSELKALRAHPEFEGEVDREALALFLRYGYIPAPHSIYQGIVKLPAGTFLCLSAQKGRVLPAPVAYWSLAELDIGTYQGTEEEAERQLDTLLRDAVGRQMVADVPLGAFLSGGIDSSLVVALMQAQSSNAVKTFTIGFEEQEYDEAGYAGSVARHLGTDHTELYVKPADALAIVPKLPTLYDEPFADSSQIPTFLVSELASRDVTVSLSGDGGDELFGGYGWYFNTQSIWNRIGWMPRPMRTAISSALDGVSIGGWDHIMRGVRPVLPASLRRAACGDRAHKLAAILRRAEGPEQIHDALVSKWDEPGLVRGTDGGRPNMAAPANARHLGMAERLMAIDRGRYLPDNGLAKVDRASMAAGLESRAPLLDHRVVEFACQLPLSMKIRGGRGKWLLRELLYRYVPRKLIDRPKMGFSVPIDQWLRGPLRDWGEDALSQNRLQAEGWFDPAPIRRKWDEHLSGKRNWQHHLWAVLMFQTWLAAQHGHKPTLV